MEKWLGALFVIAGLLALWQNHQVLIYALWLKNRNRSEHDRHWYGSQILESIWWTIGGMSSIGLGVWLLVFAPWT